jgi:hypothetical protein
MQKRIGDATVPGCPNMKQLQPFTLRSSRWTHHTEQGPPLAIHEPLSPVYLTVLVCVVSCCAVLCPAVLCCAVLCCAVLCCAVLCCAVLCCAVSCCAVLWHVQTMWCVRCSSWALMTGLLKCVQAMKSSRRRQRVSVTLTYSGSVISHHAAVQQGRS